jgi:hypothetical protein
MRALDSIVKAVTSRNPLFSFPGHRFATATNAPAAFSPVMLPSA